MAQLLSIYIIIKSFNLEIISNKILPFLTKYQKIAYDFIRRFLPKISYDFRRFYPTKIRGPRLMFYNHTESCLGPFPWKFDFFENFLKFSNANISKFSFHSNFYQFIQIFPSSQFFAAKNTKTGTVKNWGKSPHPFFNFHFFPPHELLLLDWHVSFQKFRDAVDMTKNSVRVAWDPTSYNPRRITTMAGV